MKKLMTLLALAASFALLMPVPAQAHGKHSHRHGRSYHAPAYRQLVFVGYDHWGRPRYEWRTVRSYQRPIPRYYHPGYRPGHIGGPGFRLNLGVFPRFHR